MLLDVLLRLIRFCFFLPAAPAADRNHAVNDFINRTVAAHADDVFILFRGAAGEIFRISRFLRQLDGNVVIPFGKNRR